MSVGCTYVAGTKVSCAVLPKHQAQAEAAAVAAPSPAGAAAKAENGCDEYKNHALLHTHLSGCKYRVCLSVLLDLEFF